MSTSAVATATSSAAAATSTSICSSNLYDTPVQDSNCAMPYGGNHTDIMKACCKDADVVSYYDNCGIYCLALDQTVADLTKCLFNEGAADNAVFCRGNVSSSATANVDPPASAGASVVATGGGSKASGSASGSGSSSSSSANAAPGVYAPAGVSTLGMTIGALLLSAATFGALQI